MNDKNDFEFKLEVEVKVKLLKNDFYFYVN